MSTSNPGPGWYPDPADPAGQRYWDGSGWTESTHPGWGQVPEPAPAYGTYTPQVAELTPSRMRRVAELFNDVGRIIKRAWWPILGISLLLWFGWLALTVIAVLSLFDLGRLTNAITTLFDVFERYPNGDLPRSVQNELGDAFTDVVRTENPVPYIVVGVLIVALSLLVSSIQIAAVSRLGMDAAAGQPVSWRAGWGSGFTGGFRLFGYFVAWTAIVSAVIAAMVLLGAALGALSVALAVVMITLIALALAVVSVWITGRLIPIIVQVDVAPGALRWTWNATRDRFWAVLGRYLLWSIVASVIAQIVLTIVMLPFSLVTVAAAATPGPATIAWVTGLYALTIPLSMALTALTMIGVVPIWRDLTDDPTYRSITADGHVVK